jgi:uncharacterized membrane protein YdjX (TVP38/TMEM64 family)
MGMDTECDVAVAATGQSATTAIAAIRHRLIGEHLGLRPEQAAAAIATAGSLRQVIDARQDEDHTLVRFDLTTMATAALDDTVQDVIDPDAPISLGADVQQLPPVPDVPEVHLPLPVWIPPTVAVLSAAIVVWGWSAARDRSVLLGVQAAVEAARTTPLSNALPAIGGLVALLAVLPLELGLVVAGAAFGSGRGTLVATAASLALASAGYGLGRSLGVRGAGRWVSRKAFLAVRQLEASGAGGVAMLRLAGVGGARAVHLLCGARRVPFGAYLAGTVAGLAPAIVALTTLGALLGNLLVTPTVPNAVATVVTALIVLGCALALRAFLQIRQFAPAMARHRARAELG